MYYAYHFVSFTAALLRLVLFASRALYLTGADSSMECRARQVTYFGVSSTLAETMVHPRRRSQSSSNSTSASCTLRICRLTRGKDPKSYWVSVRWDIYMRLI